MKYLAIIEHGEKGWGAHVPDLPGCIAVGGTREETLELIREAVVVHIEALREAGDAVPEPSSEGEIIELDAA